MDELKPKLNRIVYGLAALCFFLPFVNFSCSEMPIGSVTGFDMVFGSTKLTGAGADMAEMARYAETGEESPMANPMLTAENQVIEPNWFVILALGCCVLGLLLSFSEQDKMRKGRIWISSAVMIALIIFRVSVEMELDSQTVGMIQASTAIGLWLIFGLMAFAVWLNYSKESLPEGPFIRARFDRAQSNSEQIRGPKIPQN